MSRKYRSRIWRKPAHWSEERYEEKLKRDNLFRNEKELNDSLERNGVTEK